MSELQSTAVPAMTFDEAAAVLLSFPTPLPRLSLVQGEAVAILAKLDRGQRQFFGSGYGRYNVSLRALIRKEPDFLSCWHDASGREGWALKGPQSDE